MKNKIILLVTLLLIAPTVKAAELNVKTVTTKALEGTIKYSGTTDEGVLAVSCSLFNSKNEEVDISSNQVNNNKFEGTFTVTKGDTYTVKCANYEGGKIVTSTEKVNNPATGDNILTYVTILAISAAGLIINKKLKEN